MLPVLAPTRYLRLLAVVLLLGGLGLGYAQDPFSKRHSENEKGDIQIVGNTLMTCIDGTTDTYTGNSALCQDAQQGLAPAANNGFTMRYVNVDTSGAPPSTTIFNSSTADFTLPPDATVKWAGLYWSGRKSAGGGGSIAPAPANDENTVLLRVPGGGYQSLTADELSTSGDTFSGFKEVTPQVAAGGSGTYAVANVQAATGRDRYAAWSLVIVYADPSQTLRNLSVFDGLVTIGSTADVINVSGFLTPNSGPVRSTVGIVSNEGDSGIPGDGASLKGGSSATPTPLSDVVNPATNYFNSTISRFGAHVTAKNPNYVDQLGSDIDVLDASNILRNRETSAAINLTTSGDVYYPSVVTFVTDIEPVLTVTKTYTDVNGGNVNITDELEYTLLIESTGVDTANSVVLKDAVPEFTTYVPGSIEVISGANSGAKTDASGDDQAAYDSTGDELTFYLGTGATAGGGGTIAVGESTTIRFRVSVDPNTPDGYEIVNFARVDYTGQATGVGYADTSSVAAVAVTNPDSDGDGNPDFFDIDDDNDGILDVDEGAGDADGDGVPDALDIDSDNDGLSDLLESQGDLPTVIYPTGTDADNDGLDDAFDSDTGSNDPAASRPTYTVTLLDSDSDGNPDHLDIDSDNDGLTDLDEAFDTDGDGKADTVPANADLDNDGLDDAFDTYDNTTPSGTANTNAGSSNAAPANSDGDARPNHLDIDSDDDGLTDLDEAFDTDGDGKADVTPTAADADGDGMVDAFDNDDANVNPVASAAPVPPTNSDADSRANHLDIDSDGDGITDTNEAFDTDGDGQADTTPTNADADGDGLDDGFDNADTDPAPVASAAPIPPTNSDADGRANHLDIDADDDGIPDNIEAQATAGYTPPTGNDADGDGLDDAYDADDGNTDPFVSAGLTPENTDGSDNADFLDGDSDNDTVPDLNEGRQGTPSGADADNDGLDDGFDTVGGADVNDDIDDPTDPAQLPDADGDAGGGGANGDADYREVDADGNGIPDAVEAGADPTNPVDTDGDGVPDYADLDNDNDGILDATELGPDPTNPRDTDGDGTPDYLDLDADNDGITDALETGSPDANGDAIIDGFVDTNGNGLADSVDPALGNPAVTPPNFDGDTQPDYLDLDADDDGIVDLIEAGGNDLDRDGTVDGFVDTDGDGLADAVDPTLALNPGTPLPVPNSDGNGGPDYLDIDADDDGIPDNIEAQPTLGYVPPAGSDADGDGLDDAYDGYDDDGDAGTPGVSGLEPQNTDGADVPDYLDADSDNDTAPDVAEGGRGTFVGSDADGDGLDDGFDRVPGRDVNDDISDPVTDLPDAEGDAGDGGGADVDYRATDDTDGDGVVDSVDLDDDNDGIPDTVEGVSDTDGDGVPDARDRDSDNDGIPDVTEAGGTDADGDGVIDGFTDANNDGLHDPLAATPLPVPDTDGDGKPNYLDIDSDDDGITDTTEAGATPGLPINSDGDALPDYLDIDADDDGIPDNIEAQPTVGYVLPSGVDADGDGLDDAYDADPADRSPAASGVSPRNTDGADAPDYLDADSDNDGLTDVVEGGRGTPVNADADGDGLDDGFDRVPGRDVNDDLSDPSSELPDDDGDANAGGNVDYRDNDDNDGDGVPDIVDLDDDNDGIPDTDEGAPTADFDGDGVPNRFDADSDNDGVPDVTEAGGVDADGDGVVDGFTDANNDGLHDPLAATPLPVPDTDGDGHANYLDIDSDGDGLSDTTEAGTDPTRPADGDNDGVDDYLDIDADDDGIPDNVEAQTTVGYLPPSGVDADGDGLDDAYDAATNNKSEAASAGLAPENTDGVDAPDYLDSDSDNDGLSDVAEGGRGTPTGADADGDGLDDGFDRVPGHDVNDDITSPAAALPDDDGDVNAGGDVDYRDNDDADGDGVPNTTDLDDDNDGIPDTVEGITDSDGDGIPNSLDRDSDNDGIPDAVEAGGEDPDGDGVIGVGTPADVDGDGLPDTVDPDQGGTPLPVPDTDGEGKPDYLDLDSDNDGVSDATEAGAAPNGPADSDGDGLPDYRDIDADDDGIPDNIEAQTTAGYIPPTGNDADGDGLDDAYDADDASADPDASGGLTPVNTDGADAPDYLDGDSDNDGVDDLTEGGRGTPTGSDSDGDGLDDGFDDVVGPDPADGINAPATDLPDRDGDGEPDYRDVGGTAGATVLLEKRAAAGDYTVGSRVPYTVTVSNPNSSEITVTLTDTPPAGTLYVTDSAEVTVSGATEALEPTLGDDGRLSWTDLTLAAEQTATITYSLRVLPEAASPLRNTAAVSGLDVSGRAVSAEAVSAETTLRMGVFGQAEGLIIGRVYLDSDRNDRYNGGDVPLPGARVILSNGYQTLTDAEGNYAFRDVSSDTPGEAWTVGLDRATAPYAPRPHKNAVGDGYLHYVRVENVTVSDFPLEPPVGLARATRETSLTFGPLRVDKRLVPLPNGVRVVLTVTSDEPVRDLTLTDPVQGGDDKMFVFDSFEGSETLTYDLPAGAVLTDPVVRVGGDQ